MIPARERARVQGLKGTRGLVLPVIYFHSLITSWSIFWRVLEATIDWPLNSRFQRLTIPTHSHQRLPSCWAAQACLYLLYAGVYFGPLALYLFLEAVAV